MHLSTRLSLWTFSVSSRKRNNASFPDLSLTQHGIGPEPPRPGGSKTREDHGKLRGYQLSLSLMRLITSPRLWIPALMAFMISFRESQLRVGSMTSFSTSPPKVPDARTDLYYLCV